MNFFQENVDTEINLVTNIMVYQSQSLSKYRFKTVCSELLYEESLQVTRIIFATSNVPSPWCECPVAVEIYEALNEGYTESSFQTPPR
jgi:hypothetical protein